MYETTLDNKGKIKVWLNSLVYIAHLIQSNGLTGGQWSSSYSLCCGFYTRENITGTLSEIERFYDSLTGDEEWISDSMWLDLESILETLRACDEYGVTQEMY